MTWEELINYLKNADNDVMPELDDDGNQTDNGIFWHRGKTKWANGDTVDAWLLLDHFSGGELFDAVFIINALVDKEGNSVWLPQSQMDSWFSDPKIAEQLKDLIHFDDDGKEVGYKYYLNVRPENDKNTGLDHWSF